MQREGGKEERRGWGHLEKRRPASESGHQSSRIKPKPPAAWDLAGRCRPGLRTSSTKPSLTCSVCRCPWCKYPRHGHKFQATSKMSLNTEPGRERLQRGHPGKWGQVKKGHTGWEPGATCGDKAAPRDIAGGMRHGWAASSKETGRDRESLSCPWAMIM